jgi:hypothetical protein
VGLSLGDERALGMTPALSRSQPRRQAAGVALSNIYAGLANGFSKPRTSDPTVGVRIKF